MLRCCWPVPLVQLSLPRFFFLLILHYRASAMVPFFWNRLQKSPLTFGKLATNLVYQIKWQGSKEREGGTEKHKLLCKKKSEK